MLVFSSLVSCDEATSTYEIQLNAMGGMIPIEQPIGVITNYPTFNYIVKKKEWDGTLPAPFREGYAFVGWYYEETSILYSYEKFVASEDDSAFLEAHWELGNIDVTCEYYQEGNDGVYRLYETLTTLGAFGSLAFATQRFYEFYTLNVSHPDYIPSGTPVEGEEFVLRLYYERNEFVLRFFADDSLSSLVAIATSSLKFGYPIVPPPDPVRPGYVFDGWYTHSLGEQVPLSFYDGMATDDLNVWATWVPDSVTVNVEHYLEDADGVYTLFETDTMDSVTGATVEAVPNEYDNYAENLDHPSRIASGTSLEGESVTLCLYYARERFTLTFLVNGGSEIEDLELRFGALIVPPENPVRYGYVFAGWYSNDLLTTAYSFGEMPAADLVIYAKWTQQMVTLSFVTNGSAPIDPLVAQEGAAYDLPSPEYADHTFAGWFIDEALTIQYDDTGSMPSTDLTLYAKWYGPVYIIHFDTMGGDYLQILSVPAGAPLELPTPTFTGFIFVGWYDAMLTTPFTDTVMPDENLVLYAKWTPAS